MECILYGWELIDAKSILGSNGKLIDYSLWHNIDSDEWVTIVGNVNFANPLNSYPESSFYYEEDAFRRFNNYLGCYCEY